MYGKVLLTFFILRLVFVLTNASTFTKLNFNHLFDAFVFGLRLDLIPTFFVVTVIYIVYLITKSKWVSTILLSCFIAVTTVFTLIDALYFKFLKEHIGFDFFNQLAPENNISIWTYISTYWLMALVGLFFICIISAWLSTSLKPNKKVNLLSLLAVVAIAFFLVRGGTRLKPLRTADAGSHLVNSVQVVAYNIPLYIFETWQNPIQEPAFIQTVKPNVKARQFANGDSITPNFVIILLESFGKEYTGLNRGMTHTYTPFLNSLFKQSVCCHNAYANGLKSVDAVPAVFCGLPKLASTAIIHSPRSTKPTTSVFNCLEQIGYNSSFFHGAHSQTMGFQTYLKTNGLNQYFSIDNYPNRDRDFDNHWGIYDAPYFQYVAKQLSIQKEPFVSGIFTLSSHHPYVLPKQFRDSFSEGNIPLHKSIQYADMALEKFIETCNKQPWFDNTIFIITADHSAENLLHAYRTASGKYEVPLLLFSPALLDPTDIRKTVSHIDILPTILDLAGYQREVTLLGKSILKPDANQYVAHFDNETYHLTKNNWNYGLQASRKPFLFNKTQDINCLTDLSGKYPELEAELDSNLKQAVRNYFYVINPE